MSIVDDAASLIERWKGDRRDTARQIIAQVRDAALEEAAKVCEDPPTWDHATRIRALKGQKP